MKRECGSSGFTYWLFGFYLLGCDCNHAIQKPEEQTHDMVVPPGALCTNLPVPRLWSRADPSVDQEAPWGPVLLGDRLGASLFLASPIGDPIVASENLLFGSYLGGFLHGLIFLS